MRTDPIQRLPAALPATPAPAAAAPAQAAAGPHESFTSSSNLADFIQACVTDEGLRRQATEAFSREVGIEPAAASPAAPQSDGPVNILAMEAAPNVLANVEWKAQPDGTYISTGLKSIAQIEQ